LVWTPDGGKQLASWSAGKTGLPALWPAPLPTPYFSLAWSPDGQRIALGGSHVSIRHPLTGNEERSFEVQAHLLAWSADARRLAVSAPNQPATIWDVQTGKRLLTLNEPWIDPRFGRLAHPIRSFAWSPDGRRLLLASGYRVTVLDVLTGHCL